MDARPIGMFDSGSGGLSIYKSLRTFFPSESFVYVGDHAYAPYSKKTQTFIQKRALQMLGFLVQKDVKLLVVACNTATIAGIDVYRKTFPHIPIIGVVPVIKTAAEQTKNKRIAIISTIFTKKSAYQKQLIQRFAGDMHVLEIGSAHLVSLIESFPPNDSRIELYVRRLLVSCIRHHADVVVLGCTHYPFIRHHIEKIMGPGVVVLDSSDPVARHVKRIMEKEALCAPPTTPVDRFYTTGDLPGVTQTMQMLLGKEIELESIDRVQ